MHTNSKDATRNSQPGPTSKDNPPKHACIGVGCEWCLAWKSWISKQSVPEATDQSSSEPSGSGQTPATVPHSLPIDAAKEVGPEYALKLANDALTALNELNIIDGDHFEHIDDMVTDLVAYIDHLNEWSKA